LIGLIVIKKSPASYMTHRGFVVKEFKEFKEFEEFESLRV